MMQSNHPNRRLFLKAGAALSAGLMAASAINRAQAGPSPDTKNFSPLKQGRKLGSGKHQIEAKPFQK